jgi:hypothetical protein
MATHYTPQTWAVAVLNQLGYKPTRGAVQALVGWERAEGGHWNNSAQYNPLNTTQPMPGYKTFRSVGVGAADIGIYGSWDQGIDATVKTLRNGRYNGILNALKAGDPAKVAAAIDASPWGTHGRNLYTTISQAPSSVPHVRGAQQQPQTALETLQPQVPAAPGVDVEAQKRALIGSFLAQGGVKSMGATQMLASGVAALQQAQPLAAPAMAAYGQPHAQPKTHTSAPPSGGGGSSQLPSGTAMFEGKKVAAWIKPALEYARAHGWRGVVTSGFRSYEDQVRIYNSGVRPAAKPGTSNHEGADFPRGAVDVSDAATLSRILANSPYRSKLIWAGSKDPVHFSHPHNGGY